VTWVNAGLLPHTVSAQRGALESGMVQPGQSYSFTFDTPGEYTYFCRPHVVIGMTGVVVVE
jgi:plastocyanin